MSFQGNINNHKVADISIDDYIRNKDLKLGVDAYTKILIELKERKEINEDDYLYLKSSATEKEKKEKIDQYYNQKRKTIESLDINIGFWQEVKSIKAFKGCDSFNSEYMIQTSYETEKGKPFTPINIPLAKNRNLKDSIEMLKELDIQNSKKKWSKHIRILRKIIELNK